jgi:hypothetical protein
LHLATKHRCGIGIGIGIGLIDDWTRQNLGRFDVIEITVDHCINGEKSQQSAIFDLVGRIPLAALGLCLFRERLGLATGRAHRLDNGAGPTGPSLRPNIHLTPSARPPAKKSTDRLSHSLEPGHLPIPAKHLPKKCEVGHTMPD